MIATTWPVAHDDRSAILPMHYALAPRTFFFSHYFYTGLRIAVGVVGLAVLATLAFDTQIGIAIALGALCTSLMDLASPLRHKFYEMLVSVLLCTSIALIVSICTPYRWLLTIIVGVVSFTASMLVVFGRKAMPLQFAALFTMMLSGGAPMDWHQAAFAALLFFAGGAGYLVYAMLVAWRLQSRIKQQVLAESLYALANYLEIKAGFYDPDKDLREQFGKLVRQQIVLAEKQQASRDMILRGHQRAQDAVLVRVHYAMLDLYELVLAMHPDYAALRRHFSGTAVLPLLGRLAARVAEDIESVAFAMARGRAPDAAPDYQADLAVVEQELACCLADASVVAEAQAVLRATVRKLGEVIKALGRLHGEQLADGEPLVPDTNWTPFLSRQRYDVRTLLAEMRWSSPTFRYAVRVAIAISLGLAMARVVPYSSHGYWIALTIAVVLKPNFSMTRRRRTDRVVGTLIGCILTALVLKFVHSPIALFALLFVATAAGPSFLYIKYRYTAIAASMQVLLLIGLTTPIGAQAIVERLLDTGLGVLIATVFSYVLPSWEYQTLPRLIERVLAANKAYVEACRLLLLQQVPDDFQYRIRRKRLMDSIADLSGSILRMMDEPPAKRHALRELNQFVVQNYLIVAHCAALRLIMQGYRPDASVPAVHALIDCDFRAAATELDRARQAVLSATGTVPPAAGDAPPCPVAPLAPVWPGWEGLQRRGKLLRDDAGEIACTAQMAALALRSAE